MANWKFTDDYESTYPALANSILNSLVFSQHTISGTTFTGTLDVAATGPALEVLSLMVTLTSIDVQGTVTESNNTLTVAFTSTDAQAFTDGVANSIPLIGGSITQAASMSVNTVTDSTQTSDDDPTTDQFDLNVTIAVGSGTVNIVSSIPIGNGFFSLTGKVADMGITLDDLGFLMGSLATGNAWFPSTELGPYNAGTPAYGLLSLTITGYVVQSPFTISVSSVTVMVGISQLALFDTKMYLDPLGVWATVNDPVNNAQVAWGLSGAVKLLNYNNQGTGGLSAPDFTFNFDMAFPNPPSQPDFSFSSFLDNPNNNPVNLMLQDLMGQSTDVGLSTNLTINSFTLDSTADVTTGEISDFSTSIQMSGGFGLLTTFDLEEISIDVTYVGS